MAYLVVCPECGGPVEDAEAASILGYRLSSEDGSDPLPIALAVALPPHAPGTVHGR